MFFWNIIILIGVIDESSHHFSFDTHLNQDDRRASRWLPGATVCKSALQRAMRK
jgi:hypothetical protein